MDTQTEPDEFAVGASTALQGQVFRTLKNQDTFGVFDQGGHIQARPDATPGLYHRDTRHLSQFELRLDGVAPILLSSTLHDDNATLTCDLSNPDLVDADGVRVLHDLIHLRRTRFLLHGVLHERISLRNFDLAAHRLVLELRFAADFIDLFEVRGMTRARHGVLASPIIAGDGVTLSYTGLDRLIRSTRLRFAPSPARLTENSASFVVSLPPRGRGVIFVQADCGDVPGTRAPGAAFLAGLIEARRWARTQSARAAAIDTSNEAFNEAMRRAISDLTMLVTEKPTGPYPYAGVPWFSTAFGRDAIITALQVLWMDPGIASGVLRYLAANQATTTDAASDAEPGKILHEVRHGEMAEMREVPFRRYYGSVDATPLFVMLAGAYLDRTGDISMFQTLWPNIAAALAWIDARTGPEGFLAYQRQATTGLANQGWKDSFDSVFHADGTLADGPIALAEVQGYVYAARLAAARLARALGHGDVADTQIARAASLRAAFEAAFWCEEIGTYALALDGAGKPCRVRSSNAGQVLLSGIAGAERAGRVAAGLMQGRSFTGWGVRTLAAGEARYNPISYHNGSVWPHDNALIALGFARYGLGDAVELLLTGLAEAAFALDLRRLPELFCGFPRSRGTGPTGYPVACAPQAWSATALLAVLQATLGLGFDPAGRSVIFDRPRLPEFLHEVRLLNLTLGPARISVRLRRVGGEVAMNVLEREGEITAVLRS